MYIPASGYEAAYQRISTGSLLVFASSDADSVCALRILTTLLKRDSIGHKVIPVESYRDIKKTTDTLSPQVKSLVFLNCGAMVDIQDLVELGDLVVLVIDSHRPFNLYNVFWNEQVLCFDDGDVEKHTELRRAFEDIEFGSDSENEEDEDEDEEQQQQQQGPKRSASDGDSRKRRKRTDMDPEEFISAQRRRAERRDERTQNQALIQAYYTQGAYHGRSCALTTLALAEQLGIAPTPDLVWWAAVGATSQFVMQHIDSSGYMMVVEQMRDLVRRVSPTAPARATSRSARATARAMPTANAAQSSQGELDSQLNVAARPQSDAFSPYLDLIPEDEDEGYLRAKDAGLLTSSRSIAQRRELSESPELKFPLLRHWSLGEAMQNSAFVATRLATWSSKGRARLDLLLAKLGLSQLEAREPFLHLAPELKAQLHRRIGEIGADYDMSDAHFPGFVRYFGWRKSTVSADDMVLALHALLQSKGFFAAYDALAQYGVLHKGIAEAMGLQKTVVGLGISMLERQVVKTLRAFRLAISDTPVMPFALRQLALFLMQTLRERSSRAHTRLPFVIAAPSSEEDKLVVLGVTPMDYVGASVGKATYAGESRNHFGLVFESVAGDLGIDVAMGFFDSSMLVIGRSDMSAFIDRLRRRL
ncbi:DNA replication initiation factor cdc45 [Coemansia spiralis]|uniref:DNA replication initiation factor cdc45 n=1 Tax=Coemansia spiralis TaxID=417178 RepID=A0A9W8KWT7_9FUNG|nr:DNA replication initiation factor cdc45 [Coemansia spiralis]